jgi:UDP-glucose 4-epimerase
VTGGSGFLGTSLVEQLAERGNRVFSLDQAPPSLVRPNVTYVQGSILDQDLLRTILSDKTIVYHCAGLSDLKQCESSPLTGIQLNVQGTACVLDSLRLLNDTRFLFASSLYVFSNADTIYRTTKRSAEMIILDYSKLFDISFTIMRFGSIYGENASRENAIRRIVDQALHNEKVDFWGSGEEIRKYIHVADAARLAIKAASTEFRNSAVHIQGKRAVTTREILTTLNEIMGGKLEINYQDVPYEGRFKTTPFYADTALLPGVDLSDDKHIDVDQGLLMLIRAMELKG